MSKKKKTTEISINIKTVNACLVVILLVILLASLYAISQINNMLTTTEPTPPTVAKLTLTTITADCEQCFDIAQVTALALQTPNAEFEEKSVAAEAAADLIEKYTITRLPAIVVTGETDSVTIQAFEAREDGLVFDQAPAPYYDVATSSIKGLATVTLLVVPDCEDCVDVALMIQQLKQFGVQFVEETSVDYDSEEGAALIEQYAIKKVPTLIFSNDALDYDLVSQVWDQVGTEEADGKLVLREITPPYIDVASGDLIGIVDFTYIVDSTCTECYDAAMHKQIFESNFGMKIGKETTIDVDSDEGKDLVEQYGITKVPTVVLSSSAANYPTIDQVWEQVGHVADDGSYVFDKIDLLQDVTYKDLSTGEVVGAGTADATATVTEPAEEASTDDASAEEDTAEESAVMVESGSE